MAIMRPGRMGAAMKAACRLSALAVAGCLLAGAARAAEPVSDELRSALKPSTADPTLAPDLLLPAQDMAWWRDAKFGVFVHWGLYAIPAKGEWHMFNDKVPAAEYAKLAQQFNPQHYDPDAWAALAQDAGARYMVLTARHHDGFSLFASRASHGQFDAPHSAAKRDLVAPWVQAVRRQGLRVGLYYSPLDWRFPAYFHPKDMPENASAFKQQTYGQVEELMREYGRIDILWYDGGWLAHQGTDADAAWFWEPDKLNRLVRRHQPKVVINPRSGWQGDFDVEEGDAPIKGPIRARPWEKTFSINGAWGYVPEGQVKSTDFLVTMLVDAIVRNGNLLANVGPDADGVIPPKQSETLRGVGRWLQRYGQAVYGTRPGPLQPVDGVHGMTQRGDRCYLFVTRWPAGELQLPMLPRQVTGVRNLSGDEVAWRDGPHGLTVSVPAPQRGLPVTVLELRTSARP
ncbi:alpha-L-fucosidase [Ideonella sp. BN130291]|uniref:alpha-L-fucosidase n=1 Tax=Ideonella sp. BN130291 TaxID=3112940 RepID=UPI002E254765|nr:alpha-L-fucosidase [Ideonella sp. BN130291]